MREIRKTVCNRDCPDSCSIVAQVENDKVVALGGDPGHPVTQGFLCWRTNNFLHLQYSPERPLTPLLRGKPCSWPDALDFAAEELLRIRSKYGPASIFHYRSGGSLGALKGVNDFFFQKFGPVTVKIGDICSGAGEAAQLADFGTQDAHDLFDLYNSRNVILWGKNVVVSSPHTVPVLKESKARKLLIDCVWQKSANLCDRFLQPRPGSDLALAMGAARVLFERGWVDPQAASYCDHLEEFRAFAFGKPVEEWCGEADLGADAAVEIAQRLHDGPCAILIGWGMARRKNGAAIVRAVDALCAISGNLGVPGGGASYYFWRRKSFDLSFLGAKPPRTILEPLLGEQVLSARDPEIKAIWVTAGNPVASLPDAAKVSEAFRSREFVCVVDPWLTDTARLATLYLPTTTLLEDDDLLGAYGHHYVGVSQPIVPPPPGVLSDLQIAQELAKRLGISGLEGTPREWKQRILRKDAGFTLEQIEEQPRRSELSSKVLFADRKFATASGKMNLLTAAPNAPQVSKEYPLYIMAISTEKSQSTQWSKPRPPGPAVVTVHPDAARGIPDGALARLESEVGALTVRLKHDGKQRKDIALLTKGGHLSDGRCANLLSSARATDAGGGAAFYDEPGRLVPI